MTKQMARRVLARHPDDTFVYADDLTRWRLGEALRALAAFVVLAAFLIVVMLGIGLTDPVTP